jgi:hypothetical protein
MNTPGKIQKLPEVSAFIGVFVYDIPADVMDGKITRNTAAFV